MMDIRDIESALAELTYKPGWTLNAYQGEWEGPHLVIRALVPDPTGISQETELDVHSPIPPMADTAAFYRWLAWRLMRIEGHEVREFLRRNGAPLFDPHAPDSDQDL